MLTRIVQEVAAGAGIGAVVGAVVADGRHPAQVQDYQHPQAEIRAAAVGIPAVAHAGLHGLFREDANFTDNAQAQDYSWHKGSRRDGRPPSREP